MQYDRNGVFVRQSQASVGVRTVKKVLHIDSADRDLALFFTNGEFVAYLPRQYTNVVSLRLKSGTFPPMSRGFEHLYVNGPNLRTASFAGPPDPDQYNVPAQYFMIEIEGLNRCDETAVGANKAGFADSFFAKIANTVSTVSVANAPADDTTSSIVYDDHSRDENVTHFTPPIARLDRLRIRTRLHTQQGGVGFFYWNDQQRASSGILNTVGANYSLTFEIEYLDNGFDSASSFETQLNAGRGY